VPQYCDACFTGDYPIPLTDHQEQAAPNLLTLLREPGD
jgi:amidophosphoribosyltransferase